MTALRRIGLLVVVSLVLTPSIQGAGYVWIEAESIAAPPAGFKNGGWGNKHYLSGESWLFGNIDGKDAEAIPAAGIVLSYPFETIAAAEYDVWGRVGYEFVRSPFLWRVDKGEWKSNGPDDLTTDLMEVAEWTEIAWVPLGKAKLAAGKHVLEIKFERRVLPNKKQPERILAGLDCFCFSDGAFHPNGPHKPDADWKKETDKQAEKQVYKTDSIAARTSNFLSGIWQIARWDEQVIQKRDEPVRELPAGYESFFWKGITVPGNRDSVRPDMLYCHRFLYRTRFESGNDAKTAVLRFPSTALLASVFVNGKFCGGNDTPCAAWEVDITKAIKPGKINELVVAIKDCYYALAQTGDGKSCRYMFNYPVNKFFNDGGLGPTRFADFPVLFQVRGAGLFETPELHVTKGAVYVSDVFAKPSVAKKRLELEITLLNSSDRAETVSISNIIFPSGSGRSEKILAAKEVTVPASSEATINFSETWEKPRLWWPDDPHLYEITTKVSAGATAVDGKRTPFGFREWTWSGNQLILNGVPWHFRADLLHNGKLQEKDLKQVVDDWRKSGINTVRYWGHEAWVGNSQKETLDWYDSVGMPIRRTGIFDGQVAPYMLVEEKNGKTVARKSIFDHWIKQMKGWVKAERNHPSIFMWSLENEITYINIRNIGWLEFCEPEIRRGVEEVMKLDPTRPAMIDGGDALRDRSLPIYGNHYNEANFRNYPDEAYTMAIAYSRHKIDPRSNPWPIGDDKPLFLGESFFANGFPPAAYSAVIGEAAFLGRTTAEEGVRLFARMLAEGYRWHGIAGFHFWFAGDDPTNIHYKAFQPVCALVREWNSAFASGSEVKRTIKVLNDTRLDDPIDFEWWLGDEAPQSKEPFQPSHKKALTIPPGAADEFVITLKMPTVAERRSVTFNYSCSRGGQKLFADSKTYHVLAGQTAKPSVTPIAVFDPKGAVRAHLKARSIAFTNIDSIESVPDDVKLLVIGADALTPRQATDSRWQALAAGGARILVLEQTNPLHYQALPTDLEVTNHEGRIAFPENLDHPAFNGLATSDFFCWSGDHIVYRHAYKKATRGARSLLQCDDELSCSILSECPIDQGLLMLCQAVVGAKLATDPVAQRLFDNLLNYSAAYKPVARTTAAVFPENDLRLKLLDRAGLKYSHNQNVIDAVKDSKNEIVIADASVGKLKQLAISMSDVDAFVGRGGQIMLWGLSEKGLADFNRIVGFNHVLRPFKMERVTLPAKRDPLLAGLTSRDVVLEGTEKINPWSGDRFPANDTFTDIVDLDDIAPFARSVKNAHAWSQMTNGLTSADSWKFIFYHNLQNEGAKPRWEAEFPKEEEIVRFSIILNAHYHLITKMRLIFDGNEADAVTIELKPGAELRQDFDLPPRRFKRLALEPIAWQEAGKSPVIGVDNLWITVKRSAEYATKVRPLLNIGGLVRYRLGSGGIVLNQLRVHAAEVNPINAEKKQTIISTLLRNMGATFAGEKTLIAGVHMKYTPVPLDEKCNQFLTSDKGWIKGAPDLSQFPVGEQRLAGVNYVIRDFKTSPLPSCIMLAGPGTKGELPQSVTGIPVNQKADVLFFLHTFHRVKEWKPEREKTNSPTVVMYVLHYADGTVLEVPVKYERGIGHWLAHEPAGTAEASVAWSASFSRATSEKAVVYQMMWKNPHAEKAIKSIDMKYDEKTGSQYGVPVLIAVTAGCAE